MKQKVNYIVHLNNAFQKLNQDTRLSPFHISLYYSLFQYWNISKFRNPISISRDDQMQASKIGSVNTYLKCLKELDHWGYIKYEPSHNPMKGSLVYLFIFDNTSNTTNNITTNTTSDNGTNNSSGKSSETTLKKVVRPSINNSNSSNKQNIKNDESSPRTKNNSKTPSASDNNNSSLPRKKVAQKKEVSLFPSGEGRKGEGFPPSKGVPEGRGMSKPSQKEIETHFAAKSWPTIEAQKFFNYYQSNGWLVGGKTPMQSWKACASNWILNAQKFNNGKTNQSNSITSSGTVYTERSRSEKRPRAGHLHASTNKNYGEPL